MQALSVFTKVLGTTHQSTHGLKNNKRLVRHLVPCSLQAVYWSCTKSRDDGCESRKVVELPTFLSVVRD